jgi:hypothetical protein
MGDRLGDKIGPRLAQLVGAQVLAARRDHAGIDARIRQVATQALIDKAGFEVADHIAPLLRGAIDANPDMHAEVRGYLERTAAGTHQLQAIAGHLALSGASGPIGTAIGNELAPFLYSIVQTNPHLRLDASTAAAANAAGLLDASGLINEAGAQGIDAQRAQILYALAQAIPGAADLADMVNRGHITEPDMTYWLTRSAVPPSLHPHLVAARRLLLSPADAALAVLRSEISPDAGRAIAALSGMTASDFDLFVTNTGEPLALQQLDEALRRGFIDRARYARGLQQSRVRNEWLDVALALQFSPMSVADAVEAVVQNHLAEPAAAAIAAQNGLEASAFPVLVANAGEPLSRTEMEQLYNRGLVDQAAVEQALRESRLKDKYVGDAFQLHVRLPEPRQVVAMISHGVIPKPDGLKVLQEYGFSPQVAGWLVAEGTATRLGAHHTLTLAEIRALYSDGIFDRAHTEQLLTGLGYDAADAGYLLQTWDFLKGAAQTRQAVGLIRGRYVTRKLTETNARTYLHSLNVGAAAVDQYIATWNVERDATTRELTEAQVIHAHKTGLIPGQDAYDRLTAMGYSDGDALILLGVAPGSPVPA